MSTTESTPLINKAASPSPLGDTYPDAKSSCLGNVFFSWLTPLLELGNKRSLNPEDLYQLNPYNRSAAVYDKFSIEWEKELKKRPTNPRVWLVVSYAFGGPFLLAGLLKLLHDSLLFVSPMVIQGVINFLNDPDAPTSLGYYYTAAIFVAGVAQSFCLRQYFFYCYAVGMRIRSAVVTAVYAKSLRLSSAARQRSSAGEITNLMSIDAQRFQDVTPYLHGVWYGLFQIVISCYLLWQQLGPSCLAGIAFIVVCIPVTAGISLLMRKLQKKLMNVKDERIKICYDVLNGMKVIKLQAWEKSFTKRVMAYRSRELKQLRTYILTRATSGTVFNTIPALVSVASFLTYVMLGNTLDVSTALTSLALFNILRFPLFMLPQVINNVVEATVSFKRLTRFLLETERDPVSEGDLKDVGIHIDDADFTWEFQKEKSESNDSFDGLKNISLDLKSGDFCAVVGSVGCGKSTLLQAIIGETKKTRGVLNLKGQVAYVSQQPFIQNATVRDNILFGKPFNNQMYHRALRVSELEADLKILSDGDRTEIGEKGITLSGGQRTRVSIARAVYQDADIYILDDPLAAVDAHVGRHIYEKCIIGALKDKLRVLVTNELSYLPEADHILVLKQGHIAERGSYRELLEQNEGVLAQLVKSDNLIRKGGDSEGTKEETERVLEKKASDYDILLEEKRSSNKLMTIEERSTGDVKMSVYRAWIDAGGGMCLSLIGFCMYIMSQIVQVASTVWLSLWSGNARPDNQMFYLWIYVGLNMGYSLFVYIRLIFMYLIGLRASRRLFESLLSTVMRAPMKFFDTTPTGRIINRLSKDIYAIDESIPASWNMYLACIVAAVSTLITICYVTPVFAVVLIPVIFSYYSSQRYFIKTSRELQRLDSISRSPLYALLGETLDGLSTIHAYNAETRFSNRNGDMLDRNQRAYYLNFAANCWLALRLEFAGTLIGTGAALFAVMEHGATNSLFAGLAGVSLSYALNVTQQLNWSVRMISQLQTQMVSVERVKEYTEMEQEAPLRLASAESLVRTWPQKGKIEFLDVRLRYRKNLPMVLNQLTFTIEGGERIGIVGRTGAGKSSLMVVLMRLVELKSGGGVIRIDGVDISTVGLHDLREKISIIPQDPVLFAGTVRTNVDPFNLYSDAEIWTSLRRAHMDKSITALDEPVTERGSNFSVGERQLLCIARSLLRDAKIIMMDEATASIDSQTDQLIQESIREEFSCCTCLTIAHRLNTVMDSDRVLVMDKGSVAEFDTPSNLLLQKNGIFTSLVNQWRKGTSSN